MGEEPHNKCPLCDTPLTITVNDVTLHFTQHTPEWCKHTVMDNNNRVREVCKNLRMDLMEMQRLKCEYGRYADRLEGLLREHDITIPLERWHVEDMERANASKMAQMYYESLSLNGDLP